MYKKYGVSFESNGSVLEPMRGSTRVTTERGAGLLPTPLDAGDQGFEPRLPDPESGVLPLHQSPKAGRKIVIGAVSVKPEETKSSHIYIAIIKRIR